MKLAAARPGAGAGVAFEQLLEACEALARVEAVPCVEAGVSMACDDAYRRMLARGSRAMIQGVAMHRSNEPGYHRPGAYVTDDWRCGHACPALTGGMVVFSGGNDKVWRR